MLSKEHRKEAQKAGGLGVEGKQERISQSSLNPKVDGVGHMNHCRLYIFSSFISISA